MLHMLDQERFNKGLLIALKEGPHKMPSDASLEKRDQRASKIVSIMQGLSKEMLTTKDSNHPANVYSKLLEKFAKLLVNSIDQVGGELASRAFCHYLTSLLADVNKKLGLDRYDFDQDKFCERMAYVRDGEFIGTAFFLQNTWFVCTKALVVKDWSRSKIKEDWLNNADLLTALCKYAPIDEMVKA